jgi:hypothetical protein
MKSAFPLRAMTALSALVIFAFTAVGAASAAPPPVHVTSGCTGDTVSGSVLLKKGGSWPVSVSLMSKEHSSSGFAAAGTMAVTGSGNEAPFSFDVSALNASAYRVDANGVQGRTIPAASCAPGHQVPEAPLAVLLPLSLLLVAGLLVVRGRRSGRAALA